MWWRVTPIAWRWWWITTTPLTVFTGSPRHNGRERAFRPCPITPLCNPSITAYVMLFTSKPAGFTGRKSNIETHENYMYRHLAHRFWTRVVSPGGRSRSGQGINSGTAAATHRAHPEIRRQQGWQIG